MDRSAAPLVHQPHRAPGFGDMQWLVRVGGVTLAMAAWWPCTATGYPGILCVGQRAAQLVAIVG